MTPQRVVHVDAIDVPAELMTGLTNAVLRAVREAVRAHVESTDGWVGEVRLSAGKTWAGEQL